MIEGCEWRGYGEEQGTRVDDEKIVPIRIGVIEVEGRLSVAISVASAPPVAITDRISADLGELMQWAREEHAMLDDLPQQRRTEGAKEALDRAVLTRRQSEFVLQAITDVDPDRSQNGHGNERGGWNADTGACRPLGNSSCCFLFC